MSNSYSRLLLGAAAITLTAPIPMVYAQQSDVDEVKLEEIVITAEKRTDTVQKASVSIDVISGNTINQQGLNDVNDVLKNVPGVVTRNSAGGTTIEIRGVSSGGVPNNDSASPIGLSTDGVYNNLAGAPSQLSFFDVARVEVLRGPQGTLYGAGAEGGVVNVISNNPDSSKYDAGGTIEYGNYSLLRTAGMVNAPISDTLSIRAAFNSINRNGYYTSGADDQVSTSGRVKVLYKPSDAFSLLLGQEYTKVAGVGNSGGAGAGVAAWGLGSSPTNPYDDLSGAAFVGKSQMGHSSKTWLELNWDLGFGVLNILPSHIENPVKTYGFACSGPPGTSCASPLSTQLINESQQSAGEMSISNEAESNWLWKVGAYYSRQRIWTYNNNPASSSPAITTLTVWPKSEAAYAQTTVPVSASTRLTAGVRENDDEKSFANSSAALSGLNQPGSGTANWHHFDWKFGVEQDVTPDSMLYATVATGYRPGSITANSAATVIGPAGTPIPNQGLYTQPEKLTSYEIGSKNMFFDHALRLNADVYYYNYVNRQYTAFFFLSGPGLCPNGQAAQANTGYNCLVEENAAKATVYGAEAQLQWLFTAHDELGLTPAYLNAKASADQFVPIGPPPGAWYTSAGVVGPGNGINSLNINGHKLANSPEVQATGNYTHTFDLPNGHLAARADVRYTSLSYLNGFNYLNSDEYTANGTQDSLLYYVPANTQYDLSLAYTSTDGKWSLNGYGKNVGNKIVKTDTDGQYTQVGAPRTFGVVLSVHM